MSYQLFCMGDPLLDVQVRDGEELLEKYGLQPNNAIRAGEKHEPMCVDDTSRTIAIHEMLT